jgi:uncharacterized protein YbaP (TraB family)
MEAAFAQANALVVELDPEGVSAKQRQELVTSLGILRPPDGLSAHLRAETRALLPGALDRVGLSPQAVEPMRPWFLSLTLSVLELHKAGYSSGGGIDQIFLARSRGRKTIVELETVEEHIQVLANLPEDIQDAMLREQLRQAPLTAVMLALMATAWEGGNPEALAKITFERAGDPEIQPMYEAVFYARNRRMADKLAALLERPETYFAVVGAAHVVGEEGLAALLARKGLMVRQLPRTP